ncbi:MAG: hypothetical protein JWM45_2462, partial [Pseudonocardiales bacterium]|nr:hypothetical protein [Pseudonocardiales bacterium]
SARVISAGHAFGQNLVLAAILGAC